jgi:hypothetical protein
MEELFAGLVNLPFTVFAVVAERPGQAPDLSDGWLPNQFRHLVERVQFLAESHDEMATILFDGEALQRGDLVSKFNGFLYRSARGRSFSHITDAPYFVDSRHTVGMQIADLAASVFRLYEEDELFTVTAISDPFLLAIRRYRNMLASRTVDLTNADANTLYGIYRMPERALYSPSQDISYRRQSDLGRFDQAGDE